MTMKTEHNNFPDNLTATLPANASIGPYPYHNFHKLGESEGYMSEVYLVNALTEHRLSGHRPARSPHKRDQPDARVVIKIARVMDQKQGKYNAEALLKENYWLQQLNHPAIVQILPIRQTNGNGAAYSAQSNLAGAPWFTVLEYLRGGTLAQLLRPEQQPGQPSSCPLELGMVLRTIYRLASALDYIHQQGIAHLDIKPSNILFRSPLLSNRYVDPVLIDFGLVGNINQDPVKAHTQAYSAPERLCGNAPYATAAMDIYALGIVLYEMVVGLHPFTGQSSAETISLMQSGRQPLPPSRQRRFVESTTNMSSAVSRRLDNLILRMLAYAPEARPSARTVCKEIKLLLVELGEEVFPQPSSLPVRSRKRCEALPFISLLLATALILTVLFFIPAYFAQWEATAALTPVAQLATGVAVVPTATSAVLALPSFLASGSKQLPTPTPLTSMTPTVPTVNASNWEPSISMTLDEPKEGNAGKDKIRFSWHASRSPGYGQAFEIVFWPKNGNPISECKLGECYVVESDIREQNFDREIDLSLIVKNGKMPADVQYLWGVRLVWLNPTIQPIRLVSDQQHAFYLQS
jgi:serine/threonine protein kinase